MPLTPLDIVNKEFKHSLRGYHEDEVNAFLDEVVRDYEALIKENDELKENSNGMTERIEHYRKLEVTLQNTLVVAQGTADDVKNAARREAEIIVREAESKAEQLLNEAKHQIRKYQEETARLQRETEKVRAQLRGILEAQLSLLSESSYVTTAD